MKMKHRYIAIIPARYASTGFPGKPLALLGGKPIVQRVYERVKASFDYTVVATDDAVAPSSGSAAPICSVVA